MSVGLSVLWVVLRCLACVVNSVKCVSMVVLLVLSLTECLKGLCVVCVLSCFRNRTKFRAERVLVRLGVSVTVCLVVVIVLLHTLVRVLGVLHRPVTVANEWVCVVRVVVNLGLSDIVWLNRVSVVCLEVLLVSRLHSACFCRQVLSVLGTWALLSVVSDLGGGSWLLTAVLSVLVID